jgi:beta-galactosidase/beta-glucuronidase
MSIPRPEHPRPDFFRPDWLNLNGEWEFMFDDDDLGEKERWFMPGKQFVKTIIVPFCYQSELSGINDQAKHSIMWYRRSFSVPQSMKQKRILLRFGAVDYACDVYVNGQKVGSHQGGYTPFAIDITNFVSDNVNDLCLRVVDENDCVQPRGKQNWKDRWFGCWYTPVNGIWQTVYLEAAGENYLLSALITPNIDEGTASISLTLNEKPKHKIDAEVTVSFAGKEVRRLVHSLQQRTQRIIVDMIEGSEIGGFHLWSPSTPNLYDVNIKLSTGDDVTTYFGMRSVELKEGHILLNKKNLYQRLVLDQGYWPESLLTPPSDDAIRNDVEWTKKFGYNGARKHQKIEDPRYYYWADKLGLLVWSEIPSTYEFTLEAVQNLSDTLYGSIQRDFNHPCIITWVPLNESWGVDRIYRDKHQQAAAKMLYQQTKALDGTRLVSTNDGWEQTTTDILGLHDYAANGNVLEKHFEDRLKLEQVAYLHRLSYVDGMVPTGKEAFILSEYGGIAFEDNDSDSWGYHDKVSGEEAFFNRYQSLTDAARSIPYCQGYCYTQLTDVQQETNGLLTPERKPKIDYARFASLTKNPEGR